MKKLLQIVISIFVIVLIAIAGSDLIGLVVMGGEDFLSPFVMVTEFLAIFFGTFFTQGYIVRIFSVGIFCIVIAKLFRLVFGIRIQDNYSDAEYEDTDLQDGESKTTDDYIEKRGDKYYNGQTTRKRDGDKVIVTKEHYQEGELKNMRQTIEKIKKKKMKVKSGYRFVLQRKKKKKR